jgi:hypothetical protein
MTELREGVHPVEYEMTIHFNREGVHVKFTGESVQFTNDSEHPIRPRHLKIVSEIIRSMREFIQSNKQSHK